MGYKATPITYKACKSPLKADASLIEGAAAIGESKRKADYGKIVQSAIEGGDKVNNRKSNYTTFDQTGNEETKDKGEQADKAVEPSKQ